VGSQGPVNTISPLTASSENEIKMKDAGARQSVFLKKTYWDIGILGYWDIGILGYWDIGFLEKKLIPLTVEGTT
jgi:hypothetical protein